jgi:hypothetical protein
VLAVRNSILTCPKFETHAHTITSWGLIGFFVVSSLLCVGVVTASLEDAAVSAEGGLLVCTNSLSDPVVFALNVATPFGWLGAISLLLSPRESRGRPWSTPLAGVVVFGGTVALVLFAFAVFRSVRIDQPLPDYIWWMRPFVNWFGS